MNTQLLHQVIDQFQDTFRAWFPSITDQDFITILTGPAESLLTILRRRYDLSGSQARGAWNQFVLCVVDGQQQRVAPLLAHQPLMPVTVPLVPATVAVQLRFSQPFPATTCAACRNTDPWADFWIEARLA
jgi:hypothetical protein